MEQQMVKKKKSLPEADMAKVKDTGEIEASLKSGFHRNYHRMGRTLQEVLSNWIVTSSPLTRVSSEQ